MTLPDSDDTESDAERWARYIGRVKQYNQATLKLFDHMIQAVPEEFMRQPRSQELIDALDNASTTLRTALEAAVENCVPQPLLPPAPSPPPRLLRDEDDGVVD